MFYLVVIVWALATILAFTNDRRGLSIFSAITGSTLTYCLFNGILGRVGGYFGLAALALMTVVLLIVNKYDMR